MDLIYLRAGVLMFRMLSTRAARLTLAFLAALSFASRSNAAPYYTVTDVGSVQDFTSLSNSQGDLVNNQTGQSWSFPITVASAPQDILTNLPEMTGLYGVQYPETVLSPCRFATTIARERPSGRSHRAKPG